MTNYYSRSEIINFYELSDTQKKQVSADFDGENFEDNSFVILENAVGYSEAFPLSVFMRTKNNKFTHGIFSTSAFDGYFITISKSGDAAIIAHKIF